MQILLGFKPTTLDLFYIFHIKLFNVFSLSLTFSLNNPIGRPETRVKRSKKQGINLLKSPGNKIKLKF
jgi:hypothetical protein